MARNNIQFKGIRHSPSDITGQDGDLLECVNLIHENGELKPIEMPEQNGIKLTSGYTLAAVHNVVGDKIFVSTIVSSGDTSIQAVRETTGTPPYESVNIGSTATKTLSGEVVKWVETVGNTLIVGTDKSTHYALFKDGAYKWLGDKLPQPIFEFDFRRSANTDLGYYISEYEPNTFGLTASGNAVSGGGIPMIPEDGLITHFPPGDEGDNDHIGIVLMNTGEENKKIFRDGVRSKIVDVLWAARENNVFVFPFFVRYAVRMYDESYAMHSAPILMIPSSLTNPLFGYLKLKKTIENNAGYMDLADEDGVKYSTAFDAIAFRGMELFLQFKGWADDVIISDWEDIVKGVDVFMSSQISSYDERYWDDLNHVPTKFYSFNKEIDDGTNTDNYIPDPTQKEYGHCYTQNNKIDWWEVFSKENGNTNGVLDPDSYLGVKVDPTDPSTWYVAYEFYKIPIPSVNAKKIEEGIKNANLFYKVLEYDINEIPETWDSRRFFRDEAETAVINKLETLPTLPDDYVSRCRMVGGTSYNYNQRLILGNLQLEAPLWYQDVRTFSEGSTEDFSILFKIVKPERIIYVPWTKDNLGANDFGHYLYYPDVDCKEAIIGDGVNVKVVPMVEHTGLNGAYALMPLLDSLDEAFSGFPSYQGDPPSASDNRYYSLQNTIAMSKVANPFYFDASNFKDLGRTKVIGIATNTLDVSYEQWGPYPIIVFCNDGIVAVTIDREGNFTGGVDAISADVLREPQGMSQPTLVQTGQAIMFLTQRGVMMIAGTKIDCLSEAMNGRNFNPLSDLLPAGTSPSVLYNVGAFSDIITKTSDNSDFKTFAKTGFLAYDYAHNRVLLLNVNKDYQYVFSLNTGLWSKQISYTNLGSIQVSSVPAQSDRSTPTLTVVPMKAAFNNYTEMYLQDTGGHMYKTMDVTSENVTNSLYQYGYFISRPVRFGTDEYKTITRLLHRHTHFAANSFVKLALYGSRDGVSYGRVNTLRGMSYQYYIFVVYTYIKPNERYSYISVDFETRLTNKLR